MLNRSVASGMNPVLAQCIDTACNLQRNSPCGLSLHLSLQLRTSLLLMWPGCQSTSQLGARKCGLQGVAEQHGHQAIAANSAYKELLLIVKLFARLTDGHALVGQDLLRVRLSRQQQQQQEDNDSATSDDTDCSDALDLACQVIDTLTQAPVPLLELLGRHSSCWRSCCATVTLCLDANKPPTSSLVLKTLLYDFGCHFNHMLPVPSKHLTAFPVCSLCCMLSCQLSWLSRATAPAGMGQL